MIIKPPQAPLSDLEMKELTHNSDAAAILAVDNLIEKAQALGFYMEAHASADFLRGAQADVNLARFEVLSKLGIYEKPKS